MNTRPFYWSVRRELWENRSVYLAPLAAAVFMVFVFFISTIGMPHRRRAVSMLDEAQQRAAISEPYNASAVMLLVIAFGLAAYYCLDTLYGERRDRSILFWKSMPVSDRTTVLSKFTIPTVILPCITFAIVEVVHLVMLAWSTVLLLASGIPPSTLFPQFRFIPSPFVVLYGFVVVALWHAPVYAFLLFVSAWSRRAALLWATLPFVLGMMLETVTFHTTYLARFIGWRLYTGFGRAFVVQVKGAPPSPSAGQVTPMTFLLTPGLWLGLLAAAALLVAAIRLRRNREPI
jgi:ABC-2 type transport system permease protein